MVAARRMADISQEQLARRLSRISGEKWSSQQVANVETGRKQIRAGLLVVFGEALNVAPEWFIIGPPTRPSRLTDIPGYRKVPVAA